MTDETQENGLVREPLHSNVAATGSETLVLVAGMRKLLSPRLLARVPIRQRGATGVLSIGVPSPARTPRVCIFRSRFPPGSNSYTKVSHTKVSSSTGSASSLLPVPPPPPSTRPPSNPTVPGSYLTGGSPPRKRPVPLSQGSSSNSLSFSSSPSSAALTPPLPQPLFRFETGVALFAKRVPRPFPPPFLSPPSGSFSDPLSTHHGGRRAGTIRGKTNGDDAIFAGDRFICANDGVGAWSTRPRGHAG